MAHRKSQHVQMIVGCFDVSRGVTDVPFLTVTAKRGLCCVLNVLEILGTIFNNFDDVMGSC